MRRFVVLCMALAACSSSSSSEEEPTDFEKGELTRCLVESGAVTADCVDAYVAEIAACRLEGDAACEETARESRGALEMLTSAARRDNTATCTDDDAFTLGYFGGGEDLGEKSSDACKRFGEELLALTFSPDPSSEQDTQACQGSVAGPRAQCRPSIVTPGTERPEISRSPR